MNITPIGPRMTTTNKKPAPPCAEAREEGRRDYQLYRMPLHQGHWPNGTYGCADYWLGFAEAEGAWWIEQGMTQ